jgi:hypothetical protein
MAATQKQLMGNDQLDICVHVPVGSYRNSTTDRYNMTAATRQHDDNDQLGVPIEEPLCKYLGAFDGRRKDFKEIRQYFDDLFSDNVIHLMDGHPIDKSDFISINKQLLKQRMVAKLEDIYYIDNEHVEYTVGWGNEYQSMVAHVIALVVDGKIAFIKPCEETKSVFSNMMNNTSQSTSKRRQNCTQTRRNRLPQIVKFRGGWTRRKSRKISAT